jgi:hypothetical protein
MPDSSKLDSYYAHGWVELLFRTDKLSAPSQLMDLAPAQYRQVGSNLPLCEYYSPFDVYHQFQNPVDPEFGVPRALRAYDAINLCSDEFNRIVTMILVPRDHVERMVYPGASVQRVASLPLVMVTRPVIFESFYLNQQER